MAVVAIMSELPLFPGLPMQVRGGADGASALVDRLWRRIEARLVGPRSAESCWICTFALDSHGYPVMGRASGDLLSCSYVSYVRHVGPVPDGFEVTHSCNVRACVNPRHLEARRHWQNMAEMVRHGRARRGPVVKAKPCEVLVIEWTVGLSQSEIARRLGRSLQFVNGVRRRRTRREVERWQ